MTRDGNTHHLQTKVTPELAARISRSAARRGVSVSQWLRERATEFFTSEGPSAHRQPGAADLATASTDPADFVDIQPTESWLLPHLVQPDGSCVGGCDPDADRECSIGPDDPRRTGKRKRR